MWSGLWVRFLEVWWQSNRPLWQLPRLCEAKRLHKKYKRTSLQLWTTRFIKKRFKTCVNDSVTPRSIVPKNHRQRSIPMEQRLHPAERGCAPTCLHLLPKVPIPIVLCQKASPPARNKIRLNLLQGSTHSPGANLPHISSDWLRHYLIRSC